MFRISRAVLGQVAGHNPTGQWDEISRQLACLMHTGAFSAFQWHTPRAHEHGNSSSRCLSQQWQSSKLAQHGTSVMGAGTRMLVHDAITRGFAAVSSPAAHSGCGHSHHDHDHACSEDGTSEIREAKDLQQLQQWVQQSSTPLTAIQTAAAFRQAAVLAGNSPSSAEAVLHLLTPVWSSVLPHAEGKDLAGCLLSWTKLRLSDQQLWANTLAAIPQHVKSADGRDLANIAYALASMSEINGGSVPGVPREAVEELMRLVTEEVVSLVSNKPAGDGCGSGRQVSVGNLATVRWAHEVFEECKSASC